jgi:cell wall-associated NlpC family hydrolase
MKKYVIIASVMLTLAGCSASAATAVVTDLQKTNTQVSHVSFNQALTSKANGKKMIRTVNYLISRVGRTSYVFSGETPYGWDCSGMVRWTYKQFGITLPHSANKQGHLGARVNKPKIGDIVVFAYKGRTDFYHAAIYIGKGKVINANYGSGTTIIEPLSDYKGSEIRFIRVLPTI